MADAKKMKVGSVRCHHPARVPSRPIPLPPMSVSKWSTNGTGPHHIPSMRPIRFVSRALFLGAGMPLLPRVDPYEPTAKQSCPMIKNPHDR